MDYLQFLNNSLPQAWTARLGVLGAGLLVSGYIASYPYSWIQWYRTDQYRLTVCWNHYTALSKVHFIQAQHNIRKISKRDYYQTVQEYKECIKSARKGKEIYPPSK